MVYEDCESHLDAVSQAFQHLVEVVSDPNEGANFVTVRDLDNPQAFTAVEVGEALALHDPDGFARILGNPVLVRGPSIYGNYLA
jgi:hypothetical protein